MFYLAKTKLDFASFPLRKIAEKSEFFQIRENVLELVKYINKIISDLQDYARPLTLEPEDVNVNQLVDGTLSRIAVSDNVKISPKLNNLSSFLGNKSIDLAAKKP